MTNQTEQGTAYGTIAERAQAGLDAGWWTPKADTLVNGGALQMALNILKRGTSVQQEAAAELEKTARPAVSTPEGYTSDGWQPMDTAPKDGCDLLAMTMNIGKVVVYWDAYEDPPRWSNGFDDTPIYATHWMPLPLSPGAATPGDSHAT